MNRPSSTAEVLGPVLETLDEFGRDVGWGHMPPEPLEAPVSIDELQIDFTPSPADWRDQILYSVIIDRFSRARPFKRWGDPADGRTRHGGNIRGLIERLDYLKGLGVTTLQINPIFMNPPAGYHQYWPVHFLAVDPHLGTMRDFKKLVLEVHRRGMYIVMDMVFNHTAPIIQYDGDVRFGPRKSVKRWRYLLKPVELADERHYSLRGDINDWHDARQCAEGDLPGGINRLRTEDRSTQDILLKIAKWWIRETDVDGFRLDAYPHVSKDLWTRVFSEIRDYAAKLGKRDFLLMGELFDGDPRHYVGELRNGRLSAAYNYPAYFWNNAALHAQAAPEALAQSHEALSSLLGDRLHYMVNFISNHDRVHFLKENDDAGLLRFALGCILTDIGIPYLYGEEQAPRQVPGRELLDVEAPREDRFIQGRFKNPCSPLDGFSTGSPEYRLMNALIRVRKDVAALRRGEKHVRCAESRGPGLYVFSRIHEGREALVVLNSANEPRGARVWVDSSLTPAGTRLIDALDAEYSSTAFSEDGKGSQVEVQAPAYGVRILLEERPGERHEG
ncbi:MAG: alpha-amylase family glycosyl hydrolase [Elusimicrobiota bacterium]